MLKRFAPRAETPPSAKRKHWTMSTAVSTTTAALGPSRAATNTPPTTWPEVPPATGKFTICAANKNAAANPKSGMRWGGSSRRTWRKARPTPTAESAAAVAAVFPSRNPSGMCMTWLHSVEKQGGHQPHRQGVRGGVIHVFATAKATGHRGSEPAALAT